jgi:hypothetical protein
MVRIIYGQEGEETLCHECDSVLGLMGRMAQQHQAPTTTTWNWPVTTNPCTEPEEEPRKLRLRHNPLTRHRVETTTKRPCKGYAQRKGHCGAPSTRKSGGGTNYCSKCEALRREARSSNTIELRQNTVLPKGVRWRCVTKGCNMQFTRGNLSRQKRDYSVCVSGENHLIVCYART